MNKPNVGGGRKYARVVYDTSRIKDVLDSSGDSHPWPLPEKQQGRE